MKQRQRQTVATAELSERTMNVLWLFSNHLIWKYLMWSDVEWVRCLGNWTQWEKCDDESVNWSQMIFFISFIAFAFFFSSSIYTLKHILLCICNREGIEMKILLSHFNICFHSGDVRHCWRNGEGEPEPSNEIEKDVKRTQKRHWMNSKRNWKHKQFHFNLKVRNWKYHITFN